MKKILILWRDIPSQVVVQRGRVREKAALSTRFQEAIDRAAMRAGKGSSDAYIAEWRRVGESCPDVDDMAGFASAEARRIEAEYSDERLLALIRNHGEEP